ncbi:hypothetical protein PAXINDRAFT_169966 [Paxillus involutus ATCC 200175]|uniref:Unplaced genomic scaffold PAXINscaffold_24, whole genome shotgun sequence n=1 Tax=Paxillus involutus ATCC 200175 TaxID=664439 RepID=A0A0C9TEH2_PAXIN|nr:hypothetical protein PAXINDRAFT_169966 [Paxillus involutus ATCC 200175]
MIPLLLAFSSLAQLVEAASTNATSECSAPPDATSCDYRSVWSILASCGLTVLICAWNVTYPNIISAESRYTVPLYRAALGLSALLTPELTITRAYSEWRYAGQIQRDFLRNASDPHWTRTHSFFALMGGLVVQDGAQRKPLRMRHDLRYLRNGTIIQSEITKKEISDRSKSDGLGNALLVLELSWFILQVVARGANHLAITLLEIDTLALATISLPLFFFWWSKPMAPECPHVFYKRSYNGQELPTPLLGPTVPINRKSQWSFEIVFGGLGTVEGLGEVDEKSTGLALSVVWIIFGALHLIAWDFQFPS